MLIEQSEITVETSTGPMTIFIIKPREFYVSHSMIQQLTHSSSQAFSDTQMQSSLV
jgi:hypothetical protein